MATRSRIGLKLEDGTIKHSYCHFDGYPHGVGHKIVEHYSDIEKVKELLSFGDMSFLAPKVIPDGIHNFNTPEQGVTVFYGRDRAETDVDSATTSMDEYLSVKYSSCIDYQYLFSGGHWWVCDNYDKAGWELVKRLLSEYTLTEEELACNIQMWVRIRIPVKDQNGQNLLRDSNKGSNLGVVKSTIFY